MTYQLMNALHVWCVTEEQSLTVIPAKQNLVVVDSWLLQQELRFTVLESWKCSNVMWSLNYSKCQYQVKLFFL